ncbi:MAG: leucine-rich repeat domain-containing protein [Clostridia bacterium]|nr:leucine-rich repeat domain-containing protein [Clostridia bacterium]
MVENQQDTKDRTIPGVYYASAQEVEENGTALAPMSEKGGAIYVGAGSSYVMNGGTYKGSSATYGGAVYVASGGTFTMNGGTIMFNQAICGGAIYVEEGGTVNLNGGAIVGNAAETGAAIYNAGGTVIEGQTTTTTINSNSSQLYDSYVVYYVDGKVAAVSALDLTDGKFVYDTDVLPLDYNNCPGYFKDAECTQYLEDGDTIYTPTAVQSATVNNFETVRLYTKTATLDKLYFYISNNVHFVSKQGTPTGEVVIPRQHENQDVTSIEGGAFQNCSEITGTLIIPGCIKKIGWSAFLHCTGFTGTLTIPNSVIVIEDSAFGGCTGFTGLKFGSGLTRIENGVFSSCSGLTGALRIPDGVTRIKSWGFSSCSGLTSITIPDSVTSIDTGAFRGCYGLETIYYNAINIASVPQNLFYRAGANGDGIGVVFGNNVESIPANLFYVTNSSYSPKVSSVTIGSSVTSIGECAFWSCSDLTSVIIPEGVTSIGDSVFRDCSSLTNVTIPNSLISIGDYVFNGCTSLICNEYDNAKYLGNNINAYILLIYAKNNSITSCGINGNTRFIRNNAFQNCTGLTSINIPSGVLSIGVSAFNGCSGLTEVILSNTLTSIGTVAFEGCSSLIEITIPDSVTSIAGWIFNGCSSLTKITIGSGLINIGDSAILGCSSLTEVIIDSSTIAGLNSSDSYLLANATTVYVKDTITSVGTYITDSFTQTTSDRAGYNKYIKNS